MFTFTHPILSFNGYFQLCYRLGRLQLGHYQKKKEEVAFFRYRSSKCACDNGGEAERGGHALSRDRYTSVSQLATHIYEEPIYEEELWESLSVATMSWVLWMTHSLGPSTQ